ncbi:MAG: glycosyltransferase [Nitrospirae bacterium]|nr:glycosyltransferase [Nitrospirota bacterium]
MKLSIITVVLNNVQTIDGCMQSVLDQTCPDVEYIVIDGGSRDGTIDVIKKHKSHITKFISEPDKGMYDALNKGVRMASGEIIGFLHADDLYANNKVLETVARRMGSNGIDCCYGDLVYVRRADPEKIVRHWKSCPFQDGLFQKGWMPPHPTFFVRRKAYEAHGVFDTRFTISADYELMLRFFEKHRISSAYIPEVLVKMRMGGASNRSLRNMMVKTKEDYRAWKVNSLRRRFYTILLKNLSKVRQFFGAG